MYKTGDYVITRKKHPCGSDKWKILRTGLDYKLECSGCGHVILVSRFTLDKMVKKLIAAEDNGNG